MELFARPYSPFTLSHRDPKPHFQPPPTDVQRCLCGLYTHKLISAVFFFAALLYLLPNSLNYLFYTLMIEFFLSATSQNKAELNSWRRTSGIENTSIISISLKDPFSSLKGHFLKHRMENTPLLGQCVKMHKHTWLKHHSWLGNGEFLFGILPGRLALEGRPHRFLCRYLPNLLRSRTGVQAMLN